MRSFGALAPQARYRDAVNKGSVKEYVGTDGLPYSRHTGYSIDKITGTDKRTSLEGDKTISAAEAARMKKALDAVGWDFNFSTKKTKECFP